MGYGYEPLLFTFAPSEYNKMLEVSKIEVVCCARDVECLLEAVTKAARTGVQGDGIVFVTPVEQAVKVRTLCEGEEALAQEDSEA